VAAEPQLRVSGTRAAVLQGRQVVGQAELRDLLATTARAMDRIPVCGILPRNVRFWAERGDATAVAVEIEPHRRTVRWLADDSAAPFGRKARYASYTIAFPFVILLLVFRSGALSGYQQLYYRTRPLDQDETLLLPNLYNVAQGYSQRCWVCLQYVRRRVPELDWRGKIDAIVDHVFTAAFNRSSEINEGNSYWTSLRGIDPRVETVEAWQEATKQRPLFPLEVAWPEAGTTMTAELMGMLDQVVARRELRTATELAAVVPLAAAGGERR
jgi:hypothetical protein